MRLLLRYYKDMIIPVTCYTVIGTCLKKKNEICKSLNKKTTVPLKITYIIVRCITYVNMVYHNYTEYIFFIVRV